jgi:FAD synthase
VHLLDQRIEDAPESVSVEIIGRIRDVRDFENQKQLQEAIQSDIAEARAILGA